MIKKTQKKDFFILLTIIFLISTDLLSKYFFYDKIFLSNLKIFQASCNYWVSFSIQIPILMIILISIIAIFLFTYFYIKKKINWLFFVFLIAGAVWNLVDRIFLGCVRDFIVFWSFFIFNLADIFLNFWMIGLIWKEFFGKKKSN